MDQKLKRPPLRQGTDPAEALYLEQVKRDAELAARYIAANGGKRP
jgi:hypothetical protein